MKNLIGMVLALVLFVGGFAMLVHSASMQPVAMHERCNAAGGVVIPRTDVCVKKEAIIQ